jgi:hypothetical protein
MPVIIPNGLEEIWLEPGDQHHRRALEPMLTPIAEQGWSCWPPSADAPAAEQLNLL